MGSLVVKQNCPFFAVKRGNSSFSAWSTYLLFPLSPHSLLAGETFLDGSCWISSINPCFPALTANILIKLKFRTGSHLWVEFVECSVVEGAKARSAWLCQPAPVQWEHCFLPFFIDNFILVLYWWLLAPHRERHHQWKLLEKAQIVEYRKLGTKPQNACSFS